MYETEVLIRKVLAVEALSHHKPFLTLVASETVLEGFLESSRHEEHSILTNREREIV